MTALAGVWNLSGKPGAAADCRRMLAAQRIYGPDGEAVSDWGDLAIGRALFETLPEDRFDRGPIEGGSGRYLLAGDVRLDDRDALAEALGIAPDLARTMPDSAFLLRAWERWHEGAFAHLYGDYAFALWDSAERRLVLARDHLGSRPLHYHVGDGFVAFASMPKGLHALPDVPYAPDETRVAEMLALLPETGSRSFFDGIAKVEGGHFCTVTRDGVRSRRHWDPRPTTIARWSGGDAVEALRHHLDRSVASCLRSSRGDVGAHLSAGWDSAAVTATAARLSPPDGRIAAFTAVPRQGYSGRAPVGRLGDEGPLAAATAARYANIDHVLIHGDAAPINDGWDRAFFLLDRPLLNPCNDRWWSTINAEAQRRGIGVMLTGEMGNMTLSYAGTERLAELVRSGSLRSLLHETRALAANGGMRWRGAVLSAVGPWLPGPLWSAIQRRRGAIAYRLDRYTAMRGDHAGSPDFHRLARARSLDPAYRPRKDAFEARLWTMRRIDKGNFQKAAVGGYRIDQRDPTASRSLIEFCLSLPTELYLANGELRVLGRRALADRLPAEVIGERRKGYQSVDWHEGLVAARETLASDLERLEALPAAAAMLDLAGMRALAAELPHEGWEQPGVIERYRLGLLRGSALGHFLRRASRSNA